MQKNIFIFHNEVEGINMNKGMFTVHEADARNINKIIREQIVDVTITSPPYFDMKDYGHEDQIGYGQSYEKYLDDLKIVFSQVYDITKETGSLWVIIDTFKKDGEIVPLPFDFAHKIREVGWQFRDIIIWNKNKTVPWSQGKHTKNKFEYILLFSKSSQYKYEKDRVREYNTQFLKKWWVRYPERYNPKGKAPDEVWDYPIPTQGSWGSKYMRHFCPLPTDMIGRMILLSTTENDVVLDPFAGSGSVLVQADCMNRKFIGFELNHSYIEMFHNYLEKIRNGGQKNYELIKGGKYSQEEFAETIIKLRVLKYARVLLKNVDLDIKSKINSVYVELSNEKVRERNKIAVAKYVFVFTENANKDIIERFKVIISEKISHPPLSKYGIEPVFHYCSLNSFSSTKEPLFVYTQIVTHRYKNIYKENLKSETLQILSPIKLEINEEDFE